LNDFLYNWSCFSWQSEGRLCPTCWASLLGCFVLLHPLTFTEPWNTALEQHTRTPHISVVLNQPSVFKPWFWWSQMSVIDFTLPLADSLELCPPYSCLIFVSFYLRKWQNAWASEGKHRAILAIQCTVWWSRLTNSAQLKLFWINSLTLDYYCLMTFWWDLYDVYDLTLFSDMKISLLVSIWFDFILRHEDILTCLHLYLTKGISGGWFLFLPCVLQWFRWGWHNYANISG